MAFSINGRLKLGLDKTSLAKIKSELEGVGLIGKYSIDVKISPRAGASVEALTKRVSALKKQIGLIPKAVDNAIKALEKMANVNVAINFATTVSQSTTRGRSVGKRGVSLPISNPRVTAASIDRAIKLAQSPKSLTNAQKMFVQQTIGSEAAGRFRQAAQTLRSIRKQELAAVDERVRDNKRVLKSAQTATKKNKRDANAAIRKEESDRRKLMVDLYKYSQGESMSPLRKRRIQAIFTNPGYPGQPDWELGFERSALKAHRERLINTGHREYGKVM
jgi:hypothetical protein